MDILPNNGHLGCFHNLAVVNNAAVNMGLQISLWNTTLHYFGFVPRCGIVGPILFLGTSRNTISTAAAPSYIPNNSAQVPISPLPCQHLFSTFLMAAVLMGVRWDRIVGLICISLTIRDTENPFMCFWPFTHLHRRTIYASPLPIWIGLFYCCSVLEFSIYYGYLSLIRYTIHNLWIASLLLLSLSLVSYPRNHFQMQCHEAFVLFYLLRVLLF